MVSNEKESVGVPPENGDVECITQASSAFRNGIERPLDVGGRAADDFQDRARGSLLLESLGQAFLELGRPGVVGLLRSTGDTPRRFGFRFRGFCSSAHRSLLWFHRRNDRAAADDSLGKDTLVGKWLE